MIKCLEKSSECLGSYDPKRINDMCCQACKPHRQRRLIREAKQRKADYILWYNRNYHKGIFVKEKDFPVVMSK